MPAGGNLALADAGSVLLAAAMATGVAGCRSRDCSAVRTPRTIRIPGQPSRPIYTRIPPGYVDRAQADLAAVPERVATALAVASVPFPQYRPAWRRDRIVSRLSARRLAPGIHPGTAHQDPPYSRWGFL